MEIRIYKHKEYGTFYYLDPHCGMFLKSFDSSNYESTKKDCEFIKTVDLDTKEEKPAGVEVFCNFWIDGEKCAFNSEARCDSSTCMSSRSHPYPCNRHIT